VAGFGLRKRVRVPNESDWVEVDSFIESTGRKVPDSQYDAIATEFSRLDQLRSAASKLKASDSNKSLRYADYQNAR